MFKLEMHSHTFPSSCDSHLSAIELVDAAKANGYDGILITNHYDIAQIVKYAVPGLKKSCKDDCRVCRLRSEEVRTMLDTDQKQHIFNIGTYVYWNDVEVAQEYGRAIGVRVYAGCEYTVAGNTHISIIGLSREEFLALRIQPEQEMVELLKIRELYPNVLFIMNHPPHNRNTKVAMYVDGYELVNTKHNEYDVRDALEFMKKHAPSRDIEEMITICGGDIHKRSDLGKEYIELQYEPENEDELAEMLMSHRFHCNVK